MDTWGSLHAGDVVLGSDGQEWGVERVKHDSPPNRLVVVHLFRHGVRGAAGIPADLPVIVVQRADTSEEYWAAAALLGAGFVPEVIEERWES